MTSGSPGPRAVDAGPMRLLPSWLRRLVGYAVALVVLAVVLWGLAQVLMRVQTVTFAVVSAILLAALMAPVDRLLRRLRLPPWLSALLTVLLLVCVLVAAIFLVVERALSQVGDLQAAITHGIHSLEQTLVHSSLPISRDRVDSAEEQLTSFVQNAAPSASSGATMVIDALTGILLCVFLLFFFLRDGERIWQWFVRWVPEHRKDEVDSSGRSAWHVLSGYAHGTVLVALMDAIGIGAGMFVLGVPLASSLTLIVFIGAFVPIVGAFVSGALAVGVTLVLVGPLQAVILFGVVVAVQQIEGNVLQPFIMGHVLQLHPVVIVTAVTVGTTVAGILGALAAVPLLAVSYRVVEQLAARRGR